MSAQPEATDTLASPSHSELHRFHHNVKAYSAVGDGVADDTAAIQAAYDSMGSVGVLYFPEGVYKITSAIDIGAATAHGIHIRGAVAPHGPIAGGGSTIRQHTLGANIFEIEQTASQGNSMVIENLFLAYNGTGTGTAIRTAPTGWTMGIEVKNVKISNAGIGVRLNYQIQPVLSHVSVIGAGTTAVDMVSEVNLPTFENCYFQAGAVGIQCDALVYDLRATSCVIEGNSGPGILIGSAGDGSLRGAHFDSCWWEFPGSDFIRVNGQAASAAGTQWQFTNCKFDGSNGSATRHIINITGTAQGTVVDNVMFESCQFANLLGASILTVTNNPAGTSDPGFRGVMFANCTGSGPIKGCMLPLYGGSGVRFYGGSFGPSHTDLVPGTAGQFPYWLDMGGGSTVNCQIFIGGGGSGGGATDYGMLQWTSQGSTTPDTNLYRSAANVLATDDAFEMIEQGADPSAPAANKGRLYFKDNGSGKTQLCVRFNTGAVQVIAEQV